MKPKKYLLIFDDFSLEIIDNIDDDLKQDASDGDVVVVDITGAKDPREMAFPGNDAEWWSIADDSESSD